MGEKHYLESELEVLLQKDGHMWQFLQQGSLDGCWYWDLEHPEKEWISPEFWQLFGIDPATKQHSPDAWQDIIFPGDLAVALDNFKKHCADPDYPYDQIVRYRHANGSTVWVRCRGIAIRDETGKPVRMLGAHNDLTAIKRAELQALEDNRAIESASDDLRTFVHAISHDMKAPSNSLHSLLQELKVSTRGVLPKEGAKLVELSLQTVERMRKIIDDLMCFSIVAESELARENVDMQELVQDIMADSDVTSVGSDMDLVVDALPIVVGNAYQLRVLFKNLISNAIRYRSPQRALRIHVGTAPVDEPRRQQIFVSDNGIGISPEHHRRIFGLFKRLHRHEEIEGTGLGLALCRHIAKNHNADITVSSQLDLGASFAISLECQ